MSVSTWDIHRESLGPVGLRETGVRGYGDACRSRIREDIRLSWNDKDGAQCWFLGEFWDRFVNGIEEATG